MQSVKVYTDHLGYKVSFHDAPQRIISLVPSITETLYALGLESRIVGRTKFCIHPQDKISTATKVGGTKTIDTKKIAALQPDLIIANKEENTKEAIENLQEHYTVWISDIKTLSQGTKLIKELAIMLNVLPQAISLTTQIAQAERSFPRPLEDRQATVAYLIWKDPYMTVGNDTYIHNALSRCGLTNVYGEQKRYPTITLDDLRTKQPDLIFLSSEPFPFKEKHIEEFADAGITSQITLVDGEMFSWYGSRIKDALSYFKSLHQKYAISQPSQKDT